MPTIYQVFAGEKTMSQARRMVASNLWVVPSNIDLAATEMELAHVENRELILRTVLDDFLRVEPYDYVIIDCPPSLGHADGERSVGGARDVHSAAAALLRAAGTLEAVGDDGRHHAASESRSARDGNHSVPL